MKAGPVDHLPDLRIPGYFLRRGDVDLQVQYFALYPLVGREGFARYIQANNRAALFPAILAAVVVFILSVVLLFERPGSVPAWAVVVGVVLNAVNIVSTMIWQGRLHGALAATGYDEKRVGLLIRTNWIRTAALLAQAVSAIYCVYRAVSAAA
jgi:hypothetical protein